MRAIFAVVTFAVLLFACEHATPGHSPKSRINSPRCVSDFECGDDQRCVKEQHRPDGICAKQ